MSSSPQQNVSMYSKGSCTPPPYSSDFPTRMLIDSYSIQEEERLAGPPSPGLGTPLHYAVQDGRIQLVQFLLSRGADPTIKDTKGRTVLQLAEQYHQSDVVEFFRNKLGYSS